MQAAGKAFGGGKNADPAQKTSAVAATGPDRMRAGALRKGGAVNHATTRAGARGLTLGDRFRYHVRYSLRVSPARERCIWPASIVVLNALGPPPRAFVCLALIP